MEILTDTTKMPFGKYRHRIMEDVPDEYFLSFYKENKDDFDAGLSDWNTKLVMDYIIDSHGR